MQIGLSTQLKQQQTLSPQMLHALALLPLNVTELKTYIDEQIANNPALEIPTEEYPQPDTPDIQSTDYDYDNQGYDAEASDKHQQAIENSSQNGESLSDHLLKQLGESKTDEITAQIGKTLISNLDENGFFINSLQTLFENTKYTKTQINKTIELIQTFDPYGICVQDYKQSLIVQAKCCNMVESDLQIFSDLVNNHLEQMKNGKNKEVAHQLHISEEDLETFFSILKTFTPFPGRSYSTDHQNYIIPEFSVHNVDGELVLTMNRQNLPDIVISSDFTDLSQKLTGPQSKEASSYISACVQSAKNLINQIDLRYKTLYNAATTIVELQKDFFYNGPKALKTLTLKEVADKIGVHETTVSRLSQNKYVDTDWGIFQLKYFFSQGVKTQDQDGQEISRNAVKEIIGEILKDNPKLSDQKISDILKQKGIQCARRTVSKYRSELNINCSFHR